jgi:hypothetical protein
MFIPERDPMRCDLRRTGLLPWTLVLLAGGVGLRTLWRRRRQRRAAAAALA